MQKTNLKILFSLLALFVVSFAVNAQLNNEKWTGLSKYAKQNKEIINDSTMMVKAVFIGNSITEVWADMHPDFFTANNFVGRGIGGQTTPQLLSRFRQDVIDLNPFVVIINGGINDIAENTGAYDAEFALGNIKSMAELADANDIQVILTSVLPAKNIPWRKEIKDVPTKIKELNHGIKEYADSNGFFYVDYYTQMVDHRSEMVPEYTSDGVHVTDAGYKVMEPIIKTIIELATAEDVENADFEAE